MNDSESPKTGRLYGIGIGPGDPELLTLKAARIIREVPVVVVPKKGETSRSYALSIAREYLDPERQEILELVFPKKKELSELESYWESSVEAIRARLDEGKDCAFLTEGDPLFYGTFIYVFNIMRKRFPDIRVEVVPGVSSMNAAAARASRPLTNASDKLVVLPATYDPDYLASALREFDVVVLLKVSSVFDRVLDTLEDMGLVEKAVYVSRGTTPEEEIVYDIRQLRGRRLDYLSLLIVQK